MVIFLMPKIQSLTAMYLLYGPWESARIAYMSAAVESGGLSMSNMLRADLLPLDTAGNFAVGLCTLNQVDP
jgi:hypothetical protein